MADKRDVKENLKIITVDAFSSPKDLALLKQYFSIRYKAFPNDAYTNGPSEHDLDPQNPDKTNPIVYILGVSNGKVVGGSNYTITREDQLWKYQRGMVPKFKEGKMLPDKYLAQIGLKPEEATYAFMSGLAVDPKYQGAGIGSQLRNARFAEISQKADFSYGLVAAGAFTGLLKSAEATDIEALVLEENVGQLNNTGELIVPMVFSRHRRIFDNMRKDGIGVPTDEFINDVYAVRSNNSINSIRNLLAQETARREVLSDKMDEHRKEREVQPSELELVVVTPSSPSQDIALLNQFYAIRYKNYPKGNFPNGPEVNDLDPEHPEKSKGKPIMYVLGKIGDRVIAGGKMSLITNNSEYIDAGRVSKGPVLTVKEFLPEKYLEEVGLDPKTLTYATTTGLAVEPAYKGLGYKHQIRKARFDILKDKADFTIGYADIGLDADNVRSVLKASDEAHLKRLAFGKHVVLSETGIVGVPIIFTRHPHVFDNMHRDGLGTPIQRIIENANKMEQSQKYYNRIANTYSRGDAIRDDFLESIRHPDIKRENMKSDGYSEAKKFTTSAVERLREKANQVTGKNLER